MARSMACRIPLFSSTKLSFTVGSLFLLLCALRCSASIEPGWGVSNVSSYPAKSPSLVLSPSFALEARQQQVCSVPGGQICDAVRCCRPGRHCCSTGCCDNGDSCFGLNNCCPVTSQTCGGTTCCQPGATCCSSSPSGCCIAGATCCQSSSAPCCPPGGSCCGNTCCIAGQRCERGECIDASVKEANIIRLELDEAVNGDLLRNMCNGLRGKNTEVLTYSGALPKNIKAAKRRAAGCTDKYCAKLIEAALKKDPSNTAIKRLNSCDEYPPASSDEGGGTRPALQRAFNCVPGTQNTWQGRQFQSKGVGRRGVNGLKQGDKYAISIDCTKVLNGIVPRDTVSNSGTENKIFHLANDSTSFLIIPFGDLDPGSYSASVQLISGSTTSGIVIDSDGDNYTTEFNGMLPGDTQKFEFTLEEEGEGIGIVLDTAANTTNLTWTLEGSTSPSPDATTSPVSPSSTGSLNGSSRTLADISYLACIILSALLLQ